jgi:hypothetical protein
MVEGGHYLSEELDLDVGIRVMKRIMLDSHPKGWQDSRVAASKKGKDVEERQ